MDVLTNIVSGGLILTVLGWMLIRPYLYYRDVVAGALSEDSRDYFLIQGCIFGGIAVYFSIIFGFKNMQDVVIVIALFSIAIVNLYFGTKAWLWKKNNK